MTQFFYHHTTQKRLNAFLYYSAVFTLLVAGIVLLSWIMGYNTMLSLMPGAATMKANTASSFVLLGIIGLLFNRKRSLNLIILICAALIGILGLLTLLEYTFNIQLSLDTLIVQDNYSTITKNRMSPATAICFFLNGLGAFLYRINGSRRKAPQYLWLLVILIAFVSIVTFLLNIPAQQKTQLFSSMAIHTSVLFLLMSLGFFFQTARHGLASLIIGPLPGSKITRQLLPFTIFLPLILNYLFFHFSGRDEPNASNSFWIIINTISLILLSITYICIMAYGLNASAKKEARLKSNLETSNKTLSAFKKAIDKTSIVSEIDTEGYIININENFSNHSNYKKGEVLGKQYKSLINDPKQAKEIFSKLEENGIWEGELERKGKNHNSWVQCTIVKIEDKSILSEFLIVEQDISERKENERLKDNQYVAKLQQKNKELEQFLYITSHDLQEPLRSINSMLEILKIELNDSLNENTREFMDLIEGSSNRMSDLVRGLMDYARLGNESEFVDTDLNEVISEVKIDLRNAIDQTKSEVKASLLPTIKVSPVEIRLLFQNLISNGIKFRKPSEPTIIDISAKEKRDSWLFKITDNGIGIKKEHQEKIFLIFQRLNKRDEYEGTGIGLAHCMKIVALHGGELWVESEPEEGSSFYFTLPKKQF